MKCPLCDGQVVNGRCTFCGMPYKKDEILYHLNEDRSEHYKHATPKARKIMAEQQKGIPSTGTRNTRTAVQERQKQIRQEAVKHMTTTAGRTVTANKNNRQNQPDKKKGSVVLWIVIILIILVSLAPEIPDIIESLSWYF